MRDTTRETPIEITRYSYERPPLEDWEVERERLLDSLVDQYGGSATREEIERALNEVADQQQGKPLPAMNRAARRAEAKAARRAR
jgi:hypothetical protein